MLSGSDAALVLALWTLPHRAHHRIQCIPLRLRTTILLFLAWGSLQWAPCGLPNHQHTGGGPVLSGLYFPILGGTWQSLWFPFLPSSLSIHPLPSLPGSGGWHCCTDLLSSCSRSLMWCLSAFRRDARTSLHLWICGTPFSEGKEHEPQCCGSRGQTAFCMSGLWVVSAIYGIERHVANTDCEVAGPPLEIEAHLACNRSVWFHIGLAGEPWNCD